MLSSNHNETVFDLYKYRFNTFERFNNFNDCIKNNSVSYVCSFSTLQDFNSIKDNLLGNYIIIKNPHNSTFLYSRKNYYKPLKKILMFKKKTKNNLSFPLQEISSGLGENCLVHKKGKKIKILNFSGFEIKKIEPSLLKQLKQLPVDSIICEAYITESKLYFYNLAFVNGRDYSKESFVYRNNELNNIPITSKDITILKSKMLNSVKDYHGGLLFEPEGNFSGSAGFYYSRRKNDVS